MSTGVDTRPVPVMVLRWPRIRDMITQHKFIYTHLYWHPDSSASGCYLLGIESTAPDLGMTAGSLVDALEEFERRELIMWDRGTSEIYVVDWPRWHRFISSASFGALKASILKIQSKKLAVVVKNAYKSTLDDRKEKGKEKEKDLLAA
jgi:hypothetical protein